MREPAKENAGTNGRRYSMNIPRVVVPRTTDPPGVIPRLLDREKLDLERRIGEAFAKRDHLSGRALSSKLERVVARLEKLYEQWEATDSQA